MFPGPCVCARFLRIPRNSSLAVVIGVDGIARRIAHRTAHALRQLFSSIAKASARTGPAKRGRHPFDESCRMGAERVRMPKSERHGRAPLEQGTFQVCGD
jgi:hypothetical protein